MENLQGICWGSKIALTDPSHLGIEIKIQVQVVVLFSRTVRYVHVEMSEMCHELDDCDGVTEQSQQAIQMFGKERIAHPKRIVLQGQVGRANANESLCTSFQPWL